MSPIVIPILFAAMYFMLIRPQQRRVRAQRDLISSLQVGDEVVTAGGLIARIVELTDTDARLEAAPGVILRFVRPAVSRKLVADADADLGSDSAPSIDLDERDEDGRT